MLTVDVCNASTSNFATYSFGSSARKCAQLSSKLSESGACDLQSASKCTSGSKQYVLQRGCESLLHKIQALATAAAY